MEGSDSGLWLDTRSWDVANRTPIGLVLVATDSTENGRAARLAPGCVAPVPVPVGRAAFRGVRGVAIEIAALFVTTHHSICALDSADVRRIFVSAENHQKPGAGMRLRLL